jgi:hypothetical protein
MFNTSIQNLPVLQLEQIDSIHVQKNKNAFKNWGDPKIVLTNFKMVRDWSDIMKPLSRSQM